MEFDKFRYLETTFFANSNEFVEQVEQLWYKHVAWLSPVNQINENFFLGWVANVVTSWTSVYGAQEKSFAVSF